MASGGGHVAALWTEVNRCGQNGDFARALKAVNKILHEAKDDITALHCKVVCLVQNSSFKEALNVMNNYSKLLGNDLVVFEKAYCEYRLNRVESALKTIEAASEQTDKLKELYGQVLYRLERYDECKAVYTDLIRNSQDEYEEERKTNLSAVVAAMSQWGESSPEDLGLSETTYELCYNAACSLIGQGQLTEALNKLKQAEELCRVSFADDTDQNVFDSKKKVKLTSTDGVEHKLARRQLQAIDFNKALLAMYTNQAEQCRKLASGLQTQNPGQPRPVLVQVAQLCREKQHGKAIEQLQQFAEQHPESASGIKMTMAQLYLTQGHVTKACDILRLIEDFKHKQGMVRLNRMQYSIRFIKASLIHHITSCHRSGSPTHLALVREAANFKLKHGRKREAISDLEQLWKQNPKDIRMLAQLISAYSVVDADKAKSLSKHLPSPDSMALKVDVEELENSHGATYIRKKAAKPAGDAVPKEQGNVEIKKKRKKKKGKLPKNFDPKATPDPERWLPMRERTYYRGKKKGKKKEQVGKGTQGTTAGGSADLDASKTASSPPTSPRPGSASSSASGAVPPRQQKPATASGATRKKVPQKKKKSGKGGW
uniref:Signal recognition particle subunit SRP72 n=1 Tax=Gadus morhua TaxID=8049 RepID=A0A8C5AT68_GADMO